MSWIQLGVKGWASWPAEEIQVNFEGHTLVLKPSTATTEQSIHIELHRLTELEAMTIANRFLSILSWCDDQPMELLPGWSGNPCPVPVPKQVRPRGSSMAFPRDFALSGDSKSQLALALYRDGANLSGISIPLSFLSFFKILNMFGNKQIDLLKEFLPQIKDSQAVARIREIEATCLTPDQPDAATYLYVSGRCAVAHAAGEPVVDPDNLNDLRRLSQDMAVIRALARFLIEERLQVPDSIFGFPLLSAPSEPSSA